MRLEIVSHCWRYSRLLNYQLSSLVLHPPQFIDVTMTVFFTPKDRLTWRVVRYFAQRLSGTRVSVHGWRLTRLSLMRREIGRNLAALATEADWIWFTDCDHCFGPQSLDSLDNILHSIDEPLVYHGIHLRVRHMRVEMPPLNGYGEYRPSLGSSRPSSFPSSTIGQLEEFRLCEAVWREVWATLMGPNS